MPELSEELDLPDGIYGKPVLELSDLDLLDSDLAICCDFSTWRTKRLGKEGEEGELERTNERREARRSRHHPLLCRSSPPPFELVYI